MEDIQNQETGLLQGKGVERISRKFSLVEKLKHLPVIEGWTTYMHQEAMLAGLALALLYFTVLRCSLLLSMTLVVYIFCGMQNGYLDDIDAWMLQNFMLRWGIVYIRSYMNHTAWWYFTHL